MKTNQELAELIYGNHSEGRLAQMLRSGRSLRKEIKKIILSYADINYTLKIDDIERIFNKLWNQVYNGRY